jgi:putative two-component system response regulator
VYKAAIPYSEAVKMISEGKGTQFDPVVCDALIEIQGDFRKIAEQYV